MYSYLKGQVEEIKVNAIVLEVGGIGYLIYTPNPYDFKEETIYKVYIYHYVREDELTLFGFKTNEELELFLKLIKVKGVGPRTALPILATGSVSGIIDAIERENILYLKKFPKIGEKIAKQMILDLKGKLNTTLITNTLENSFEELKGALLSLGYKDKEIKQVIGKIDSNMTIDLQIKEALKLLLK